MLKRILLVLDDSRSSKIAKEYAIQLAKSFGARLTGLAVIDTPWITAAQPEPLGGAAYKIHRDQELIKQIHGHMKKLLKNFVEKCEEAQIAFEAYEREGLPVTEIEKLSQEHNLIIMGKSINFHLKFSETDDLTVKHIIRDCPRPLIVLGSHSTVQETVLIAYDGSLQAARTLHLYLLLGLAQHYKVHIISIARHEEEAHGIAKRAHSLCKAHGVEATTQAIISTGPPEDIIVQTAKEISASLIVMGAFGRQGLRDFFFGSCTEHVMQVVDTPLFIYH